MRCRFLVFTVLLLTNCSHALLAQRIMYAPPVEARSLLGFMIAGKVDTHYWIQKEKKKRHTGRHTEEQLKEEQDFDVYDSRLQLIKTVPAFPLGISSLKKYIVTGNLFFDEVVLSRSEHQTIVQLRRYSAAGVLMTSNEDIGTFPFNEPGNSFIMAVSEDKNKILLLGFESVSSSAPKLHAILFNGDWKKISYQVYEHPFITQPFIQDDFFCTPSSSLNNNPVQLADNGEWLMAAASRTNHNFLLFHFSGNSNDLSYKEIALPSLYTMEDIALSIDNEKGGATAGILSRYRLTANKNVHVTHYSFSTDQFDFDSSYRFSTLAAIQSKDNNIIKENLIPIPDNSFMLLKEYGRTYSAWNSENNLERPWDPQFIITSNIFTNTPAHFPINTNGYTRYNNLGGLSDKYERGDLSLFYFPGHSHDSAWSGIINKKQITELNAPTLSYLFIPFPDKLIFLYNSIERNEDPFGFSTTLDTRGNLISDREVISWQSDQSLIFQQSVRITKNEVAVPYARNQQRGFAVIKF